MNHLQSETLVIDSEKAHGSERTLLVRGVLIRSLLAKLGLPIKWLFIALIWFYRYTLGVFMGGSCRFEPSCSHYAEEALHKHGALKGLYLGIRRILRCNPWGPFGPDPVPERENSSN